MLLKAVILSALLGLGHAKTGKAFSLFNVVQFPNNPCVSDSSSTSSPNGYRNGTCLSAEECTDRGGMASGNCASGFGTCCLFAFSECGKQVSENNTYVRNEGYPAAVTQAGNCAYSIKKCADDICTLRLDFDAFNILAGTSTDGKSDEDFDCQDTFQISGSPFAANIPTICGKNNGQHMYIELDMSPSSSANLNFVFSSETYSRTFEIKISQYACGSTLRPPPGCLQYFTGTEGRITSYNFEADLHHLNDQLYQVCVRQEEGFCCVEYSVCADAGSFTLDDDESDGAPDALHASYCSKDYIEIVGSANTCYTRAYYSRYCGDALSTNTNVDISTTICDCTAPFAVTIRTNSGADGNDSGDDKNRGLCLNYRQRACGQI